MSDIMMMMMIECCDHSLFSCFTNFCFFRLLLRQITFIPVILNISNYATVVFIYSVYPFSF
jgi:hypothetical protein